MALQKQAITFNFASGIDTKIDPNQLPIGKFEELKNSVFDKIGRLQKRNGFGQLTSLPDASSTFVTTFNGNLTALGTKLQSYSPGLEQWVSHGYVPQLQLSTLSLVQNNTSQIQSDTAISYNNLVCTVYTDQIPSGSTTALTYKYAIADASTGQNIIPPTAIVSPSGATQYSPRVWSLRNNFVVMFDTISSASLNRLEYFSINASQPTMVSSVSTLSNQYHPSPQGSFDGVVANDSLYVSFNSTSSSGIKAFVINSSLQPSSTVTIASASAQIVSVTADTTGTTPVIWTATYNTSTAISQVTGVVVATNSVSGSSSSLSTLFSAQRYVNGSQDVIANIAPVASNGQAQIIYEYRRGYSYNTDIRTNTIASRMVTQTGSLNAEVTLVRSLGLASKSFLVGSSAYVLGTYSSPNQSTYFLINSTGNTVAKVAYGNGYGYYESGLPSVYVNNNEASLSYILKTNIQAVNTTTNVPTGTNVNGIYSQTGINLVNFTFGSQNLVTSEIGQNLNMNGGFLWAYDGYVPTEHGFHVYPDSIKAVNEATGSVSAQTYFYRVTYEWTDNQGNAFKSAPSIPVQCIAGSNSSHNTVSFPTLRLTYKTANPVKIVVYRWSAAQPIYYQVTSITQPVLNDTTTDNLSYSDSYNDVEIVGNTLLYTEGGVLENIEPPAPAAMTIFDSRLWTISAENPDTLFYSKQVIAGTPVETSDLLSIFVSPNAGAQGPTGPMTALAPMDDKLIIFKKNAIYYINGRGPDNTGANSQYSEPTFITGTVGCDNENSIVLIPQGLVFQSDKGIWLLGRDLSTQYIGKEVERYNDVEVLSAVAVPGTNQVRFTLETNLTLMYDYFVGQWGSFVNIPGISSTLYQDKHTFINRYGQVFQETPGLYVDGTKPTVMSWKTGWLSLAGLQGYKRIYNALLLGEYISPHIFTMGVSYNYFESVSQQFTIVPDNFTGTWGSGTSWGSVSYWGGNPSLEQFQMNFQQQQCQSFQLSFQEYYDASLGVAAGAGLEVSGITVVAGLKDHSAQNIPAIHRKA